MPTYREQYDKIIQAYFRDEIQPYNRQFCFCGTLGYMKGDIFSSRWDYQLYHQLEYANMERALLTIIRNETIGANGSQSIFIDGEECSILRTVIANHKNYETALFNGMCAALEVLKEIHISRGEKIDEDIPQFTKRNLSTNKIKENELVTN